MNRELIIKKCNKCGALIHVLKDCTCSDCNIKCCNNNMKELKANESDGAIEKHKPTYEIIDNKIVVTVNHVMDDDHYIEFVTLISNNKQITYYLKPEETARVEFEYLSDAVIYSYCNKHGLWKTIVE